MKDEEEDGRKEGAVRCRGEIERRGSVVSVADIPASASESAVEFESRSLESNVA